MPRLPRPFRTLSALCGLLLALAGAPRAAAATEGEWIDVGVGQSHVFTVDRAIGRVLVSDPEVAEIKLLERGQVQIRGVNTGSTDIWIWFQDDMARPVRHQLTVHRDLADLVRRIDELVDGPAPRVYTLLDRIVVEGPVPDVETLERIAGIAAVYDEEFVNLMTVDGDHQIQLDVVFAEVNRTALREMGLNVLWGNERLGIGLQTPETIAGGYATLPTTVENSAGELVAAASSYVNGGTAIGASSEAFNVVGVLLDPAQVAAVLSVLEQNSISKVLARPTLTVLSGQQAEFLAGGEIPIPVAQTGSRISLEFKEYGVKLIFVPTVLAGNVVDMRVYVEVSAVDSANGVRLTGIEIPAFMSRKSESHLRVRSGMTFAMAGMLHDTVRATYAKVPLLGDVPVLGALFRYVKHRRTETELMIFVTPRLVRPMSPAEVPPPPGTTENLDPSDFELFLLGMDHAAGSRTAEEQSDLYPAGRIGLVR